MWIRQIGKWQDETILEANSVTVADVGAIIMATSFMATPVVAAPIIAVLRTVVLVGIIGVLAATLITLVLAVMRVVARALQGVV